VGSICVLTPNNKNVSVLMDLPSVRPSNASNASQATSHSTAIVLLARPML
jgi:hypothetical protein